jgi:hypothetical protein
MNKKIVVLTVAVDPETKKEYIYPDLFKMVPDKEKSVYETCVWIEGRAARVQIISHNKIDLPTCQRLAIAYMTGRYHQWSFSLTDETPKWRKVR